MTQMSVFIHHRAFAVLKKKIHVTSSKKKVREIKAERNLFGQLVLLAEHQYRQNSSCLLGSVSWTLATTDGSPMNTAKTKLPHSLDGNIT